MDKSNRQLRVNDKRTILWRLAKKTYNLNVRVSIYAFGFRPFLCSSLCKVCKVHGEETIVPVVVCHYVKHPSPWRYVSRTLRHSIVPFIYPWRRLRAVFGQDINHLWLNSLKYNMFLFVATMIPNRSNAFILEHHIVQPRTRRREGCRIYHDLSWRLNNTESAVFKLWMLYFQRILFSDYLFKSNIIK